MTEYLVELGKLAYEAYRTEAEGRSTITAEPLPAWEDQSRYTRNCWNAAANEVLKWANEHPKS